MAQGGDDLLDDRQNERVGYGQPPRTKRIKAGEVRNPWGRKGKPGSKKDFMEQPFEIIVDGIRKVVMREEALDHALFNAGLKGKVSAVRELERRRDQRARAANEDASDHALPDEHKAAFERYLRRYLIEQQGEAPKKDREPQLTDPDSGSRKRK